jgi:hypothetical protein
MRGREGRQRTAHGNNISSQFWVMQLQESHSLMWRECGLRMRSPWPAQPLPALLQGYRLLQEPWEWTTSKMENGKVKLTIFLPQPMGAGITGPCHHPQLSLGIFLTSSCLSPSMEDREERVSWLRGLAHCGSQERYRTHQHSVSATPSDKMQNWAALQETCWETEMTR